ncbi:MAG: NHL repeat-containing protein, partial [Bacteroidota bacterium]
QIYAGHDIDSLSQSVGGYGWTSTTFDRPTGIATDGLNVYVSDYGNHRIQRFDRNLIYLSSLATRDTSINEARFGYPTGVALSQSGDLFVLDGENYRVLRFSQDARFQQTFGGTETGSRKITNPLKIVIAQDNAIYVAEPTRILEFDYFGNLVNVLGEGVLKDVRSFCIVDESVVVLTRDSLIWFSRNGIAATSILTSSLITVEPLQDPRDLVVTGKRMLLLDAKRLHVFSIVAY